VRVKHRRGDVRIVRIIVTQRELSPEGDVRLKWIESFGIDVWRDFVQRMEAGARSSSSRS
jgi:hypothetical protein